MALITDADLLKEVKVRLSIQGDFHDSILKGYIHDTKTYLTSAGVKDSKLLDDSCIGVISRGVSDLWNFESGNGSFSDLFLNMAAQAALDK